MTPLSKYFEESQNNATEELFYFESKMATEKASIYCVFEGIGDPPFYLPYIIREFGETKKINVYLAKNRSSVLSFFYTLEENYEKLSQKYKSNSITIFFVDRDWHLEDRSNLESHQKKLFVSNVYSIENYFSDKNTLWTFLAKYLKFEEEKSITLPNLDDIIVSYEELLKQYIQLLCPFTALSIIDRKNHKNFSVIEQSNYSFHEVFEFQYKDRKVTLSRKKFDDYNFLLDILKLTFSKAKLSKFKKQKNEFQALLFGESSNIDFENKKLFLRNAITVDNLLCEKIVIYITKQENIENAIRLINEGKKEIIINGHIRGKFAMQFFLDYLEFLSQNKICNLIDAYNNKDLRIPILSSIAKPPTDLVEFLKEIKNTEQSHAS